MSDVAALSKSDAVRDLYGRRIFPAVSAYYPEPIVLARGRGVRVEDAEGNEYLDLFAGILTTSVGHANAEVTAAVTTQLERLGHTSSLYVTEPAARVADRLVGMAPEGIERVFFTNSGTEAVETAIMAARMHTGRSEIVTLRHAYSGRSMLATSLTAHAGWRPAPGPAAGVSHAQVPYTFRCPYGQPCDDACIDRFIDDLVEVIDTTTTGKPAALIFEPIQGVGGFIVLPDEYMRRAAEVIRAYGGLLIIDEVQTGFGRTGDHWWGIDHAAVRPDMMVMAKGIANGFPVGATVATEEVAQNWDVKTISTFGGSPITMAAAEATLTILERENAPARAAAQGAQFRAGLDALAQQYAWIGEARGRGLMQALEVVGTDNAADAPRAAALLDAARQEGLLIGLGGLRGNVIRMGPSLLIEAEEISEALERLGRACARVDASA